MKLKDLQNLYGETPEAFHNALLTSLYKLDEKKSVRYKKRRRAARVALVCAIVAALGTVTAVAATTKLFGLLQEPVGKYGLHMSVVEDTAATETTEQRPKYVKLKLGYMTEGFTETPNSDGYKYHDANDEAGFSFMISRVEDFEYTEEYIVDSYETTVNGHKLIVMTRQIYEDGSLDYIANEYFENWGYVVWCIAHHGAPKEELMKIMENLDLEEDKDFVPETTPDDWNFDDARMNYGYENVTSYQMHHVGEAFEWGRYADENGKADDFTVKITSIKEQTSTEGIPEEYFNWTTDYSLAYPDFFDESGNLITPYTRIDEVEGDGINTQRVSWEEVDDRHFFVVTMDVTCNTNPDFVYNGEEYPEYWFDVKDIFAEVVLKDNDGNYFSNYTTDENGVGHVNLFGETSVVCSTPGDENNLSRIEKGETRTFTLGIVIDDDVLNKAYITFASNRVKTDDEAEKFILYDYKSCIKIKE